MSYPGPPGSPGYPPAQQPTTQFAAPTQQFGKAPEPGPAADGPSKLPVYLTAAVVALGLLVYLASFGPMFGISSNFGGGDVGEALGNVGVSDAMLVVPALLAALLAATSLLPKAKDFNAVVAAIAVLGLLLVLWQVVSLPDMLSPQWALWLVLAFTLLQAVVAVTVLLFDAGIITPPTPKPRYDQQYGQYGGQSGPYYGQVHHGGPPQQQGPGQRPGYPSPYGGGYPGGAPSTGGFPAGQQSGPPTPPTGFPTYGTPQAGSTPTAQVPAQPQSSSASSNQTAPPPS